MCSIMTLNWPFRSLMAVESSLTILGKMGKKSASTRENEGFHMIKIWHLYL